MSQTRWTNKGTGTHKSIRAFAAAIVLSTAMAWAQPLRAQSRPITSAKSGSLSQDLLKIGRIQDWKVTQVSHESMIARNPKTGALIQFAATPNGMVGQRVWINEKSNLAQLVVFPINAHRKDRVGSGHMESTVIVSNKTGRIDVTTRTWTSSFAEGMSGGVAVFVLDKDGQVLNNPAIHAYGVNAQGLGNNDRTEVWHEMVSSDLLNQARSVAIVQKKHSSGNHIQEFLNDAKEVAEIAKTLSEAYKNMSSGSGGGGGGEGGGAPTGNGGVSGGGPAVSSPPPAPKRPIR